MQKDREKNKNDFKQRLYVWTIKLITVVETIPTGRSNDVIVRQLIRSATSVGANVTEAQAGSSKKDFTNFITIALKSANETKYWLALLRDLKKLEANAANELLQEITEIANILGASILTLKNKR
jgi:four helix bundle protein